MLDILLLIQVNVLVLKSILNNPRLHFTYLLIRLIFIQFDNVTHLKFTLELFFHRVTLLSLATYMGLKHFIHAVIKSSVNFTAMIDA